MIAVTVASSAEAAAGVAADRLAREIEAARRARGVAHVALAGGTTPRRTYELLARERVRWREVEVWFGDERAGGPDDPESNFALVRDALLAPAGVPSEHVHRMAGEDDLDAAARAYAALLRERVPTASDGLPVLDVAFLGLGRDGHTASLFPGDLVLGAGTALVRAVTAPVSPPRRLTLDLSVLRAARSRVLLATGEEKAGAVAAVLGRPDARTPASLLAAEDTEVVVDRAAAELVLGHGERARASVRRRVR